MALQHHCHRLDGSCSRGAGLTFFSHCVKRDSGELCGQVCLRLGNKRGIFCSPGWLAARAPTPLESITNHEMGLCLSPLQ